MKRKQLYASMNGLVLLFAVLFVVQKEREAGGIQLDNKASIWLMILLFFIGLLVVHMAKLLRCYLVLMEHKISFARFIRVYIKTTFVNIVFPFKLGELFRIYCFTKETKDVKIGFLSVLIDRFFDTCALLVLLVPFEWYVGEWLSIVSILLLFFVLGIVFIYWIFQPTYQYLNHFLIMNTSSRRTVDFLTYLETAKAWFDYIKDLITGRYALIFLCSCAGWVAEFGVLTCMTTVLGQNFGIIGFVAYIESIFSAGAGTVLDVYTTISSLIFAVVTGMIYIISYVKKGEFINGKKNSSHIR